MQAQVIFSLLSTVLSIYSLLLIARIILTWFSGSRQSGVAVFLARIVDPYLDWWRQRLNLRVGFLDLSPLIAIAALSALQTIFAAIAVQGVISLGIILAVLVSAVWRIVSFLLWFCIIVLAIRLVGFFMNKDMYGPVWQIVDSIARPIMFRVTRMIFRDRLVNFVTGIIISIALFVALWAVLRMLFDLLVDLLRVL